MRTLGYVVVFGLLVRAGLWVFGHEATAVVIVAVAVGTYLVARSLIWLIPEFARGARRGWRRGFHGEVVERRP